VSPVLMTLDPVEDSDLEDLLENVNFEYFDGAIDTRICWMVPPASAQPCDKQDVDSWVPPTCLHQDLGICIHPYLHEKKAPRYVKVYLIYHELLQILFPPVDGQFHPPGLVRMDRNAPHRDKAHQMAQETQMPGGFMVKTITAILAFRPLAVLANDALIQQAAERHGVDPDIVEAIANIESKQSPYALNINGIPVYPESKSEAVRSIVRAYKRPWAVSWDGKHSRWFESESAARGYKQRYNLGEAIIKKVDVNMTDLGFMQINWFWHGWKVDTVDNLLSMDYNIDYAAKLLARLIDKHGFREGIKRYHASKEPAQSVYFKRFSRELKRIRGQQ